MFQIGRGNHLAQHGIHWVAHIWNTNNLSLLCRFNYLMGSYRSTHINTLHPFPGIWSVKGNTTQTIHSYPYYNIQCITDIHENSHIYMNIHIHLSIENIHVLAQARFSSGKHPYISMPIILVCLGPTLARRHHRCQLTTVRSMYNSAHASRDTSTVRWYTQAEPMAIRDNSLSTHM